MNAIDDQTDIEKWLAAHNSVRPDPPYHPHAERHQIVAIVVLALFFLIACTLAAFKASAQTVPRDAAQLQWVHPTQNTDGTAIPASCPAGVTNCGRLTQTRLEYGSCSGTAFGTKVGEITVAAPANTATVSALVPQVYCFRAFSRNDFAAESAASNVGTKTIAAPTPKAPLLSVDTLAYEIKTNSAGRLVATRIGLVPMGTLCASEQQQTVEGETYSRVDRAAVDVVNWPANLKLADVWAKCGKVNL
jgi:hypothetical protein